VGVEQLGTAHAVGAEGDVVAVVVLPAALRQHAAAFLHPGVQRGAFVGRQDAQKRHVDADLLQLIGHRHDAVGVVAVESRHEAGHDADAALVQPLDAVAVLLHLVLRLVGVVQRVGVERFDAEEDADAARGLHQIEQLVVACDVHARLGQPPAASRDHRA